MNPATDLAALDARELWDAMTGRQPRGCAEVRRLCVSDGVPRLGWINPPPWSAVSQEISALHDRFGGVVEDLVVLGTGGWAFAAQALSELGTSPRAGKALSELHTSPRAGKVVGLDSLDPARIRAAIGVSRNFLAVSESGRTLETRRLAEAVAADGRVVWLRDELRPHVAMLGAPLSPAFLYPASIVDQYLEAEYEAFLSRYERIAQAAAQRAVATSIKGQATITFTAPPWAGPGLRLWLLQLGRQVLCGKSPTFRPHVTVTDAKTRGADGIAGLFDTLYEAGIFAGALALRAGLDVCAHPNVKMYKELLGCDDAPIWTLGEAERWLARRPDLKRVHAVFYGSEPFPVPRKKAEIYEGSAWNHHSFQAVYADPETAVLLVIGEGDTDGTLRRIAIATHRALPGRSLLIRAGKAV